MSGVFRAVSCACALVLGLAGSASARQAAAAPTVDDLKAPAVAAATLLGTSPTAIERPDSPQAFVVNVISHITKDEGVPKNFGVLLTPYWMRWHPRLTFESYAKPSFAQRVARTFAISLASADWKTGQGRTAEDLGSRLALGFSATPFQGAMDPEALALAGDLAAALKAFGDAVIAKEEGGVIKAMRARRRELARALETATGPDEAVAAWRALNEVDGALGALVAAADADIARLDARRKSLARRIERIDTDRYGARLAVAGAWSWAVPADVVAEARVERAAVWITPSYRVRLGAREDGEAAEEADEAEGETEDQGRPVIELVGVARYLREPASATGASSQAWDLGARFVWQIGEEIALSTEVVRRAWESGDRADTYRAAGIFEARLAKGAHFFAAFGRDYEEKTSRSTLLSVVGVNFGLGPRPVLAY